MTHLFHDMIQATNETHLFTVNDLHVETAKPLTMNVGTVIEIKSVIK